MAGHSSHHGKAEHSGHNSMAGQTGQNGMAGHSGHHGMAGHSSHRGMAEHSDHNGMAGPTGQNGMAGHSGHHGMTGHHGMFLQLQTSASLLVPEWSTESIYGLTGAMLAAVAASITYECLTEYLLHIKRTAVTKPNGSECCGVPVITFGEKLGQSIIQTLRVIFGYFMMFCVMTMNVWLLVAVVVGAFVGYGVGKPLVANRIEDSFTSHGYESVSVKVNGQGRNKTERSRSWRYQPIVKPNQNTKTRQADTDDIFLEGVEELDSNSKYSKQDNNGANIVWIRRSTEDLRPRPSEVSDVFDDSDIQLRSQDDNLNFDSIRSEGRHSSRSSSRFRSTSKVINDSFRSYKSESEMRKHSTSANTSLNVSFDSQVTDSTDRGKTSKSSSSKVSRTTSTASAGRFKPVSREIMRQMSFNEDQR